MPSGGHALSGPAPDPNALRRERDKSEWVHISLTPRTDPAPAWPLSRALQFEADLWEREWRRPVAVMWERLDLVNEAALYVRSFRIAQGPKGTASDRKLVQSQMDRLGLTVSGMRANRWVFDATPEQAPVRTDDPERISAKSRLRSIDGGAA